jgi:hypothetical protein
MPLASSRSGGQVAGRAVLAWLTNSHGAVAQHADGRASAARLVDVHGHAAVVGEAWHRPTSSALIELVFQLSMRFEARHLGLAFDPPAPVPPSNLNRASFPWVAADRRTLVRSPLAVEEMR